MSKGNGFFSNLKKSTRMTIISCSCFVVLTAMILFFFVMFPITPSEKVIAGFGREGIYKEDSSGEAATTTTVTTTGNDVVVSKATRTTTKPSRTTRTEFTIIVTSGSGFAGGFYVDNRIPTGVYPNESFPTYTTTADMSGAGENPEPTTGSENGGSDIPQPTSEAGGNDTPQPTSESGGDTPAPDPGNSGAPESE